MDPWQRSCLLVRAAAEEEGRRLMVCILVIDDEPETVQTLQGRLRAQARGWQVETARSLDGALEHLSKQPCDVVIADIHSRQCDTVGFLEMVKNCLPEVTRVVLSGGP